LIAWEGLSVIVDGLIVKQVVIASFTHGVIAYWPPHIDREVLDIFDQLYIRTPDLSYMLLYDRKLNKRYLVVVNKDKILAMEVDERVDVVKLGEKLLGVFEKLNKLAKSTYSKLT